ncbi:MAG: sugar-binding domain-containing protein, partial [Pirellulaceae bacterium]
MKHRAQKLIPAHRGTLGWMWLGVILAAFDASALGQDATGPGEERPVARLSTPWTDQVDQRNPHPEYPRPQMERLTDTRGEVSWNHLNGLWDYQITDREASEPSSWEGQILVPFPIESQLSGVQRWVSPQQALWYHRSFASPPLRERERLLLHLGACDWETSVWVDGKLVGSHRGGYDPFTLDITESLQDQREHRLVIRVWDPTDSASQPRGKQVRRPEGIWYTAVTG